jgi:hypothetical protein
VLLEFLLAAPQGCLIGLNFVEAPANFSRFLSGHAAMFVKFHGVIRHGRVDLSCFRGKILLRDMGFARGVFPGALTSRGGCATLAR